MAVPKPTHTEFEVSVPATPWDAPSSVKQDIDELSKAFGKSNISETSAGPTVISADVADHALQGESEEVVYFSSTI